MGSIDHVAHLGELLCGLANNIEDVEGCTQANVDDEAHSCSTVDGPDGVIDCVDSMPSTSLSDVQATVAIASATINITGIGELQRGLSLKLSGNLGEFSEPTAITDVRNAMGFPAGFCQTAEQVEACQTGITNDGDDLVKCERGTPVQSELACGSLHTGRRRMQAGNTYTTFSHSNLKIFIPFPGGPPPPPGAGQVTMLGPSIQFGFVKPDIPLDANYVNCRQFSPVDWEGTSTLAAADTAVNPAQKCAETCKMFNFMGLSGEDTCLCGNGEGSGAAQGVSGATVCDTDADTSSDACAVGGHGCEGYVAVYRLTGLGSAENAKLLTFTEVMLGLSVKAGIPTIGVYTKMTLNAEKRIYFGGSVEVQFFTMPCPPPHVTRTCPALPNFVITGYLIGTAKPGDDTAICTRGEITKAQCVEGWQSVGGMDGLDIHEAALSIGFTPPMPGPTYFATQVSITV